MKTEENLLFSHQNLGKPFCSPTKAWETLLLPIKTWETLLLSPQDM
jgi:hypothetical protein